MLYVSLAGPGHQLPADARRRARRRGLRTTRSHPVAVLSTELPLGIQILFTFAVVNLFLGLFNLLPIPPLDGSALLERVLPEAWLPNWYKFRPYGFLSCSCSCSRPASSRTFLDPFERLALPVRVRMSAMKVAHLSGRFVRALWPGAPRADDVAWVETVLTPDGFAQFRRQPNHDQRHAIGVARDVQARLADTAYADDPRWLSAALLHDIGKLDSHLGVYGRVVATVSGARSPAATTPTRGRSRRGFTRRVGLYLRHAELGADRIRLAGEPEEAALGGRRPTTTRPPGTTSRSPRTSSPPSTKPTTTDRTQTKNGSRSVPSQLASRACTRAGVRDVAKAPVYVPSSGARGVGLGGIFEASRVGGGARCTGDGDLLVACWVQPTARVRPGDADLRDDHPTRSRAPSTGPTPVKGLRPSRSIRTSPTERA